MGKQWGLDLSSLGVVSDRALASNLQDKDDHPTVPDSRSAVKIKCGQGSTSQLLLL